MTLHPGIGVPSSEGKHLSRRGPQRPGGCKLFTKDKAPAKDESRRIGVMPASKLED